MKQLIDYINEMYTPRGGRNYSARGLYLFYMVKYRTHKGMEEWSYCMSEELKYEPAISEELGFKTEDTFRKFIFSCFLKQKKEIAKEYEARGYTDIDIICSPKYILRPQPDSTSMKTWMSNVFNEANKYVNNARVLHLTGDYERYAMKFDRRVEEIKRKYEEDEEIRRKEEWEKYRTKQEMIKKEREEFMKQHADDTYYQIYGWPWDRKDNWTGD